MLLLLAADLLLERGELVVDLALGLRARVFAGLRGGVLLLVAFLARGLLGLELRERVGPGFSGFFAGFEDEGGASSSGVASPKRASSSFLPA